MTMKKEIKVEAFWDKPVVPADIAKKRGLMLDVMAQAEKISERRPINLSMVIDRSGSMSGGRLNAAKEAAKGVVARLEDEDVFSLVVFDSQIETLVTPVRMTRDEKRNVIRVIDRVNTRGCTNLAGGWLEGARCAANACDAMNFKTGHVILLSDGHANEGIVDPSSLQSHADEMASRGITTSTVGVGNGYSPLQLEALSEGGLGRLHDAGTPEEMIEAILGELGEVVSVVGSNVELHLHWPAELRVDLLADYRKSVSGNTMTIRLGQLLGGSNRTVPLMIDVPALPAGEKLTIGIELSGKDSESGDGLEAIISSTSLTVLPPEDAACIDRDTDIAERIAGLWESTLGLESMRSNERGDFVEAAAMLRDEGDLLVAFCEGTNVEKVVQRNLRSAEQKVGRTWDGRSKRESMIAAKKFSKGEQDHRSGPKGDWSDHL
jgi:Ca-activated chloride channel family protein